MSRDVGRTVIVVAASCSDIAIAFWNHNMAEDNSREEGIYVEEEEEIDDSVWDTLSKEIV